MSRFYWIKLGVNVPRQPRVIALARRLGDKRAWSYVVALWCYACEQFPKGRIPASLSEAVEVACGWEGTHGVLMDGFVREGLLVTEGEWLLIHKWDQWQGEHIRKAERDAERMRLKRERDRAEHDADMAAVRGEGSGTRAETIPPRAPASRDRRATVPRPSLSPSPSPSQAGINRGASLGSSGFAATCGKPGHSRDQGGYCIDCMDEEEERRPPNPSARG